MKKNKYKLIVVCIFALIFLIFGVFRFLNLKFPIQAQSQPNFDKKEKVLGSNSIKARGNEIENLKPKKLSGFTNINFSDISAKSFLIYDERTGKNLAEHQVTEKLSVASLTKLLTGLVAYENLKMDDKITIDYSDKLTSEPILDLKVGDFVLVYDLFASMIIGSANDAALTLANFTSKSTGKDFVELMNKKANSLGMLDSRFANPLGFDSKDNFSTAGDLKKLVLETQKLSAFISLGKKFKYSFYGSENFRYSIKASNKLIFIYPGVESIKTGYTPEANGSLISKIEDSGRRIVIIVLGSENREQDTVKLSERIFKAYKWE